MTTEAQAGQAFLDALAVGESGPMAKAENISPYFILVGGGSFEHLPRDVTGFPLWEGRQFPTGISHAAGRYQFEPATWHEQAAKLGLTDFSPASQDIAAWDLAVAVYRRLLGRDLLDDLIADVDAGGGQIYHVAVALQSTWTSLNPNTFPTRYRMALGGPPHPDIAGLYTAMSLAARPLQKALADLELYKGALDGIWGPQSAAAYDAYRKGLAA